MTAPAEDPRGGERPCCGHPNALTDPLHAMPTAGKGDTDSSGEPRVRVRGEQVAVHLTGDGWFLVNDARWLAPTEVEDWGIPASLAARPAGDRAQPTEELRVDLVERWTKEADDREAMANRLTTPSSRDEIRRLRDRATIYRRCAADLRRALDGA